MTSTIISIFSSKKKEKKHLGQTIFYEMELNNTKITLGIAYWPTLCKKKKKN